MNENDENKFSEEVQGNEPINNEINPEVNNESEPVVQPVNEWQPEQVAQPVNEWQPEQIAPQNNIPEKKERSNLYWIVFIVVAIIIFIIILLLLKGCNSLRNQNKSKINEANTWVTNMWNKCVDPIYWYTVDGTGVDGADIDIDNVLNDCDTYYNEYQTKKTDITSLDNEYSDFKNTFAKISEQIEIIYPKIKAEKPVAKNNVEYEENMEIFYEHQLKLYNLIKEKYS